MTKVSDWFKGQLDPQHLRPAYRWRAVIADVHDGDTVTVVADRGLDEYTELRVRLIGCNARELSMPGGKEAGMKLQQLLPIGAVVVVTSVDWDKFGGRILGHIEVAQLGELYDVATEMIRTGYAAPWDGKGPKRVPPWPIPATPPPTPVLVNRDSPDWPSR